MPVDTVNVTAAAAWLQEGSAIIIDVREPDEYKQFRIKNAPLVPLGQFTVNDIPETDKKIIIHCKAGGRSLKAAQIAVAANPSLTVYNMTGGMIDWLKAGLPVEQG